MTEEEPISHRPCGGWDVRRQDSGSSMKYASSDETSSGRLSAATNAKLLRNSDSVHNFLSGGISQHSRTSKTSATSVSSDLLVKVDRLRIQDTPSPENKLKRFTHHLMRMTLCDSNTGVSWVVERTSSETFEFLKTLKRLICVAHGNCRMCPFLFFCSEGYGETIRKTEDLVQIMLVAMFRTTTSQNGGHFTGIFSKYSRPGRVEIKHFVNGGGFIPRPYRRTTV